MNTNPASAEDIIKELRLQPLPREGGYFRETYRDPGMSCIYYLLSADSFSALHSLRSTEIWHFYAGDPVHMIQISPSGVLQKSCLGNNLKAGQVSQILVPPHTYQGARVANDGKWALFGCTVSPCFDPSHFALSERCEMIKKFPHHFDIISRYTRP